MKKWILFACQHYYSKGGMDDAVGQFDSIFDCARFIEKEPHEFDRKHTVGSHVLCIETGQVFDLMGFMPSGECIFKLREDFKI